LHCDKDGVKLQAKKGISLLSATRPTQDRHHGGRAAQNRAEYSPERLKFQENRLCCLSGTSRLTGVRQPRSLGPIHENHTYRSRNCSACWFTRTICVRVPGSGRLQGRLGFVAGRRTNHFAWPVPPRVMFRSGRQISGVVIRCQATAAAAFAFLLCGILFARGGMGRWSLTGFTITSIRAF
jgi:hypothetical protein